MKNFNDWWEDYEPKDEDAWKERDAWDASATEYEKVLAECQATNKKLREALTEWAKLINYQFTASQEAMSALQYADHQGQKALQLPQDDSALREAIAQAKRELWLEAADWWDCDDNLIPRAHSAARKAFRRMAEEIK